MRIQTYNSACAMQLQSEFRSLLLLTRFGGTVVAKGAYMVKNNPILITKTKTPHESFKCVEGCTNVYNEHSHNLCMMFH